MNSESNHWVIKVSFGWRKRLDTEYGMQGEKQQREEKQDREKMKWVLFRLQAEKEQYEEKQRLAVGGKQVEKERELIAD